MLVLVIDDLIDIIVLEQFVVYDMVGNVLVEYGMDGGQWVALHDVVGVLLLHWDINITFDWVTQTTVREHCRIEHYRDIARCSIEWWLRVRRDGIVASRIMWVERFCYGEG